MGVALARVPPGARGAALARKLRALRPEAAAAVAAERSLAADAELLRALLARSAGAHSRAPYYRALQALRRAADAAAGHGDPATAASELEAFAAVAERAAGRYQVPARGTADGARRRALRAAAACAAASSAALAAAPPLSALLARGHFAPLAVTAMCAAARLRAAAAALAAALARAYAALSDAALALPPADGAASSAGEELPLTLTVEWEGDRRDVLALRAGALLDLEGDPGALPASAAGALPARGRSHAGASPANGILLERTTGLGLDIDDLGEEVGEEVCDDLREESRDAGEEVGDQLKQADRHKTSSGEGRAGAGAEADGKVRAYSDSDGDSDNPGDKGGDADASAAIDDIFGALGAAPAREAAPAGVPAGRVRTVEDIFGELDASIKSKAKPKPKPKAKAVAKAQGRRLDGEGGGAQDVLTSAMARPPKQSLKAPKLPKTGADAIDDIFGDLGATPAPKRAASTPREAAPATALRVPQREPQPKPKAARSPHEGVAKVAKRSAGDAIDDIFGALGGGGGADGGAASAKRTKKKKTKKKRPADELDSIFGF